MPGWQSPPPEDPPFGFALPREEESFARRVEQVTRLDLGPEAEIDRRTKTASDGCRLDYLVAFRPGAPLRCVGIADGPASTALVADLEEKVFGPLRQHGAVELLVVHHGPDDPVLRVAARESGVRIKTWTEYDNLLEAGAYRTWLRGGLEPIRLEHAHVGELARVREQLLREEEPSHRETLFGIVKELARGDESLEPDSGAVVIAAH
ncbi:MAG TPA: hypothetical protein VFQ44_15000 [Streptosporangiaceae bacterium]|nr:hypothetical protein [Streptosporangiaceae bacterium]